MQVEFTALLSRFDHGRGVYHLVRLPAETSDFLNDLPLARHGFQSIKVTAGIKSTTWDTSIFPSNDSFILLVSKWLIAKESLEVDRTVNVTLDV